MEIDYVCGEESEYDRQWSRKLECYRKEKEESTLFFNRLRVATFGPFVATISFLVSIWVPLSTSAYLALVLGGWLWPFAVATIYIWLDVRQAKKSNRQEFSEKNYDYEYANSR